ncbi:MAG: carbohydrate kinase [Saprospiraceae bacterium]|uniref:Carbohydrate kinase n=1 Tax=Candidatus Opimibacter skivensis TaxID=2982028 RepID=A0A9D7ST56_9BACT|nr:carbohydrate kinase [Candidatus Opimibacter skivensis]
MITKQDLLNVLAKAKNLKATVIGDAMLDRYIYGTVDRISPEAPVPILAHQRTELKAGGAANVALNLAAWGCETSLVGLVGKDENAILLKDLLESRSIKHKLIACDSRPTTIKTRVVASSHHLLRIDQESSAYLAGDEEKMVINELIAFIEAEKPDIIILQDYNKGMLTEDLIQKVEKFCVGHDVYLAIDPKERNFSSYGHADLFKPNLREASLAAKKTLKTDALSELAETWRKTRHLQTIAITLGSQGIFLQDEHNESHIRPSKEVDVVDVCGAGDAVICSLAIGLISGLTLEKSGELANLTGAFVCSHSGVVAIDTAEIMKWVS